MDIDEVVDDFMKESEIDYVGLWELAHASREDLGARTIDEVRRLSSEVVRRLYERGLRPGDYWGRNFDYWPDEGCQAVADRIEREWIKANADPQSSRTDLLVRTPARVRGRHSPANSVPANATIGNSVPLTLIEAILATPPPKELRRMSQKSPETTAVVETLNLN